MDSWLFSRGVKMGKGTKVLYYTTSLSDGVKVITS
jgi:hypothetical protein